MLEIQHLFELFNCLQIDFYNNTSHHTIKWGNFLSQPQRKSTEGKADRFERKWGLMGNETTEREWGEGVEWSRLGVGQGTGGKRKVEREKGQVATGKGRKSMDKGQRSKGQRGNGAKGLRHGNAARGWCARINTFRSENSEVLRCKRQGRLERSRISAAGAKAEISRHSNLNFSRT